MQMGLCCTLKYLCSTAYDRVAVVTSHYHCGASSNKLMILVQQQVPQAELIKRDSSNCGHDHVGHTQL